MRFAHRAALAILIVVALVVAARTGMASEDGEIWVTAQNASELKILLGMGEIETVPLPTGAEPHTISFSPDGSYAYVSNLGNGDLIIIRAKDRQIVATLDLGATFTHDTKPSPDGSILLSANRDTGVLTKIAADEDSETWTAADSLNVAAVTGRGPMCVAFRSDGDRAYVSLFGPAGGIALVDVPSMTFLGVLPTAGSVSGCGLAKSSDGRTIFYNSAGGTGHFYRLDTATDTLTEDVDYGPIGSGLHGLAISANEKRAYMTASNEALKVLDLNGTEVATISLDWRPSVLDLPDSIARRGSNIYVTLRFAGQVARVNTQSGSVDYIELAPPATTGWAIHGIAVRP